MTATAHALPISGVVIAKDEADRIGRCVASLAEVCSEVLVLDSGSGDATVAVATAAGARVEHQPWLGFSAQKNAAIARASQPWVLLLDADEWLAPETAPRLRALFASGEVERADVWRLLRRTHFLGAAMDHGGWGREPVERLFRPDLRYLPADVHERLDLAGRRVAALEAHVEHDTARDEAEYAASSTATRRCGHASAASPASAGFLAAPLHAAAYWLKNYLLRGGFLDGPKARRYHALHTRYVFRKYVLLRAAPAALMPAWSEPMSLPDRHLDLGCGKFPRNPYARGALCGVDIRPLRADDAFDYRIANLGTAADPVAGRQLRLGVRRSTSSNTCRACSPTRTAAPASRSSRR
ncbi:MAG: glycosyltransferase family 2 protein [Lysobacterales bacterium]